MSVKNIWVINQFAGSPTSGWGERHYYFAEYWLQAGYRVNIISGSYNHMFSNNVNANGTYTIENINGRQFCWTNTPRYNAQSIKRFWSMMVFAWRMLRLPVKELGKPDYIVVSSMPIFPIITASMLKRKYSANKLVFEIRDLWPLTPIYLGGYSKNHPFILMLAWIEKFGYKKADRIVSLLPNADKYINNISGRPEKFAYIPNGLSEDILVNEQISEETRSKIPSGKFIVGYAGTLGLANALEYFVDAAALVPADANIHFVVIGDGYMKKELEERAKATNNITFIGKIPKNQVQDVLRFFDVCFVGRNDSPLFEHGVSANKYFDYMLAGKPILDSNKLIKDPVELSGCGIIVQPNSAQAIADGVMQFFNMSPAERQAMGCKGAEYVRRHHSIRFLANKYLEVFEGTNSN